MHLKRQKIPKTWPIERKGTTFLVKPKSNLSKGIPILLVLRDILNMAQNRREVKRIIHNKQLIVNNKLAKDERNSVVLFDTITLVPLKKSYRVTLSDKGKFTVEEISEAEANTKVSKVVKKKILRGKKTQLNLGDGMNFISDIKCNVNDSVMVNLKDKKLEKCVPLNETSEVMVFAGKHSGSKGTIQKINVEGKSAEVDSKGKKINVLLKQLMAI